MKRKYYMRGLSIGVIVTTLLMAFLAKGKEEKLSDAKVIARAKELGYTYHETKNTEDDLEKLLARATETPSDGTEDGATTPTGGAKPSATPEPPSPPVRPERIPSPTPTAEAKPTDYVYQPTKEPSAKPTSAQKALTPTVIKPEEGITEHGGSGSATSVRVERGMSAKRVAALLEENGAISDASTFVRYLVEQKLTDSINIGSFSIPAGAGHAEIAKILTE